ncbi:MAG: hypothetical protein JXB48_18090 [Candidatus Latescibacteria bacterium]|nr:hypothetical protein [Candidatus Latescibacterota bacterium]
MVDSASLSNVTGARIRSVDAFRGFIMFSMLLHTFGLKDVSQVSVVGFIYNQLNHVPWIGFHFEDIILPAFLFIIGVAMGLSDVKRRQRGESDSVRLKHAMKRAIILFCLGFILSWVSAGKPTLGPGVLQVLAFSYFGGYLFLGKSIKVQFYACAALLFIYWFFIFTIPVYDVGRNSYEVFKNLVYLIDNTLTGSTSRWGYLYTLITSIAVVVYGSIIGKLLVQRKSDREFMKTLAIFGVTGIFCGLALHPVIPIIKRMFTPSYTLFTCGLISLMLMAFFWIIDVRGKVKWSFPFMVLGMNSIFVYMLNGLLSGWLLDTAGIFVNPLGSFIDGWVSPLQHIIRLGAEWLVCLWLYKRKIFFKI